MKVETVLSCFVIAAVRNAWRHNHLHITESADQQYTKYLYQATRISTFAN